MMLPSEAWGMGCPDIEVETCAGKIRGLALDQCHAFLGIPYARAKRFEAPVAVEPWSGTVHAIAFGPVAPQRDPDPSAGGYGIMLELFPPSRAMPAIAQESEACQVLNVWTSNLSADARKPVMVWLHSGGFMLGSGESGDGATLAGRGDVVVVSINHRLNVFGYCHLDELGDGFRHAGSAGQLDIVAALGWIQRNIERFGGDPNRVMVFGASGGGMKTAWLMASPLSRGLMQRAGSQSGPCLRFVERDVASDAAAELLAELGLNTSEANALRTIERGRLLAAYHRLRARNRSAGFGPVLDPAILPRHPFDPDAAPAAGEIPMLLGWNREDMAFFQARDMSVFDLPAGDLLPRIEGLVGDRAEALTRTYQRDDRSASPAMVYLRILSDKAIGRQVMVQAERHAALGRAPAYAYRFDHPSPVLGGRLGALHSSETDYVFGQDGPFMDSSTGAMRLGECMRDAWTQFASTGDPNVDALPRWNPFGSEKNVMLLSAAPRLTKRPIPAMREFEPS